MTLDILGKLEEAIRDSSGDFAPPTAWRFSNIGKCLRAQVLQRRNEVTPEPFSTNTRILFKVGNLLEPVVLSWLEKSGIQVISNTDADRQVRAEAPEYDARGSLDALGILDGEVFPIEIKSTRTRGLDFGLPYETHELQATAYALFLGLSRSLICYVGRDGGVRLCWVYVTPEKEQRIKREWAELSRYFLSGEIPPVKPLVQATKKVKGVSVPFLYERDGAWGKAGDPKMELDNECGRCSYQSHCWPAGEQR
jgi:CRISPR/Cas system-associated exonuclease Cas4 (RecB family)